MEGDFLEKDNERDGGYDDQVPLVSLPTSLEMEIFIQKGDKPLGEPITNFRNNLRLDII